jgi:hypothetical protein
LKALGESKAGWRNACSSSIRCRSSKAVEDILAKKEATDKLAGIAIKFLGTFSPSPFLGEYVLDDLGRQPPVKGEDLALGAQIPRLPLEQAAAAHRLSYVKRRNPTVSCQDWTCSGVDSDT